LDRTVRDFASDVACGKPAPGGGSVAALAGAMGAALASMVAKIALRRIGGRGENESMLWEIAEKLPVVQERLLRAIEDDAAAFLAYQDATRLPSATAEERERREGRIQETLRQAIDVPHQTALAGLEAMEAVLMLATIGPMAATPDAAVGGEVAFVAVRGSLGNIEANLVHVTDAEFTAKIRGECASLLERALKLRSDLERLLFNGE
jgi:glutamate formiminotransferase/formiminotetrahydrofolate cyclodeaminase